jgi:hypothetical protein
MGKQQVFLSARRSDVIKRLEILHGLSFEVRPTILSSMPVAVSTTAIRFQASRPN